MIFLITIYTQNYMSFDWDFFGGHIIPTISNQYIFISSSPYQHNQTKKKIQTLT